MADVLPTTGPEGSDRDVLIDAAMSALELSTEVHEENDAVRSVVTDAVVLMSVTFWDEDGEAWTRLCVSSPDAQPHWRTSHLMRHLGKSY